MKLIIVRHGQTDRNVDEHRPGHHDISLNAIGRSQVARLAERLSNERIDRIYVSTLQRAKETAQAIAAHHPGTPVIVDAEIHERESGIYAARPVADKQAAQLASGQNDRDWRPPGGESLRDVKERARRWFDRVRRAEVENTIVVVSHGLFLYTLLELAIEDGADVERKDFRLHNAGFTVLEVPTAGSAKVVHLNNIDHFTSTERTN